MANEGVHGEYLKTELTLPSRDELSNPNREKRISIYTLDPTLKKDIVERLQYEPRLAGYAIRSTNEDTLKRMVSSLTQIADGSKADKIMIMDARRATLTLLRPVFNRVIPLNRRDFSRHAFAVLIADGPADFLKPGKTLDVFVRYLLDLSSDFSQSLFFYDPLIHYQSFETPFMSMEDDWKIADHLPDRFRKELIAKRLISATDDVRLKHMRRHFRGVKDGRPNEALRQKRMAELRDICVSRLKQLFPDNPQAESWATQEGYFLEGYGTMHMYPFAFEQLVADLVEKTPTTR